MQRADVVAGVDGWVSPNEPLPLRVNLGSDLLLVGRIDVSIGGATTSQAVEVPAGGVKDYFIQDGTPSQRRQLRVQLISENGSEETILETAQISLRVPANEVVVAVVDADPFESAIRSATPDVSQGHGASSWSFVRLAPALLVAVGVVAFWDAALLSLFPLYGLEYGREQRFITLALAVCILGNTVLQIPIGWIADHTSRRGVMIFCAIVAAAGAAFLPAIVGTTSALLSILFIWGAAVGGLYTMAMAELGDRFSGAELVAGNAAFAVVFGLGGLVGGPVTGVVMDLAGADGFPRTLTMVFLATAAFAFWRRRV